MSRGRHRLRRRPSTLMRARRSVKACRAHPKTPKAPKFRTGHRDGVVVGAGMAFVLGGVAVAAVLTPGGARLAPVLAEIVPAPTAPVLEPAPEPVFVPPAEFLPAPIVPAPSAPPAYEWLSEREDLIVPTPVETKPEPRGKRWKPDVDHSRDSHHDAAPSQGRHVERAEKREDRPRPTPYPRGDRDHGERERGDHEDRERGDRNEGRGDRGGKEHSERGGRGDGDGGNRGGHERGDRGERGGDRGGGDRGGKSDSGGDRGGKGGSDSKGGGGRGGRSGGRS